MFGAINSHTINGSATSSIVAVSLAVGLSLSGNVSANLVVDGKASNAALSTLSSHSASNIVYARATATNSYVASHAAQRRAQSLQIATVVSTANLSANTIHAGFLHADTSLGMNHVTNTVTEAALAPVSITTQSINQAYTAVRPILLSANFSFSGYSFSPTIVNVSDIAAEIGIAHF